MSTKSRSLRFPFIVLGVVFIAIGVSGAQGRADRTPWYLDTNDPFYGAVKNNAREIIIVGPNPFQQRWTVSVVATTVPAPDLSTIFGTKPIQDAINAGKGKSAAPNKSSQLSAGATPTPCNNGRPTGPTASPDPNTPLSANANNIASCNQVFASDLNNLGQVAQALQTAESDTVNNVNNLRNVPAPSESPDEISDNTLYRAAYIEQYEKNIQYCVMTYTTPAPSPSPSAWACPSPPVVQPDGNMTSMISLAKNLNQWDVQVNDDQTQIAAAITSVTNTGDATDFKNYSSTAGAAHKNVIALLGALKMTTYDNAPLPQTPQFSDENGNVSTSWVDYHNSFVYRSNTAIDTCRSNLFNGTSYTFYVIISTPSPSPSPSPTNSTSSGGGAAYRKPSRAIQVAYAPRRASDSGTGGNHVAKPDSSNSPKPKNDQSSPSPTPSAMNAQLDCLPIAFVGVGYGADTVPNISYTSVPNNSATSPPMLAPFSKASKQPATIQELAHGYRPILTSLANFEWSPGDDGSGFVWALGAALPLNNPGPGWKYEILTGPGYSYRRAISITGGLALGSIYQLQPGYTLGGPIKSGMAPPTKTLNLQPGVFLSINVYVTK